MENNNENFIMTDKDYLSDIPESEKNISSNINTGLNEFSNESLYKEIYDTFEDVRERQRELYEFMFSKNWYELCAVDDNKIETAYNKLKDQLNQLEN